MEEINETEIKRTMHKINQTKSWDLKIIFNNINKLLAIW